MERGETRHRVPRQVYRIQLHMRQIVEHIRIKRQAQALRRGYLLRRDLRPNDPNLFDEINPSIKTEQEMPKKIRYQNRSIGPGGTVGRPSDSDGEAMAEPPGVGEVGEPGLGKGVRGGEDEGSALGEGGGGGGRVVVEEGGVGGLEWAVGAPGAALVGWGLAPALEAGPEAGDWLRR